MAHSSIKSFKNQLVIILVISTILPAMLISSALLLQIMDDAKASTTAKLALQVKSDLAAIQNQLDILTSRLEQLALDQNIVLAAENAAFSVTAQSRMSRLRDEHPEISIIQLYDTQLWPAESLPSNFEFVGLDSLFETYPLVIPDGEGPNLNGVNSDALQELIIQQSNRGMTPLSSEFLIVTVALTKQNEVNPQKGIDTGFLIAVVSLPDLLAALDDQSQRKITLQHQSAVGLDDALTTVVKTGTLAINEQNIYFSVASSRDDVVKPIDKAVMKVALTILVVLLISISLAWYMSRRFTRPMGQIKTVLESYGNSQFNTTIPHFYFSEFQQLSLVLVSMANQIEKNQKELESRVATRTRELADANNELTILLEEQRNLQSHLVETEKMAQLGGLVAGVAHEINTPVGIGVTAATSLNEFIDEIGTGISTETLTKKRLNSLVERSRECSDILVTNLSRSAELISNFKEVAVSQTGSELNTFNLKTFLSEIIISLYPQTRKYNVSINFDIDEWIELHSYQGVFAQILTNFIMNSLKHAFNKDEHYTVTISAKIVDEAIKIVYSDDGSGMESDVLNNIFEPFYTTKRGKGGTGLGMHIVFNLVTQKLEGKISVDSEPDTGTQIKIILPCTHLVGGAVKH